MIYTSKMRCAGWKLGCVLLLICFAASVSFLTNWYLQSSRRNENGIHRTNTISNNSLSIETFREVDCENHLLQIKETIASIAKDIHKAKQHVRGSKTSDSLKQALEKMTSLLSELNINPNVVYNRNIKEPINVCPEKFMGTRFGYPLYHKGFETTKCDQGKPIWKLVTIIKHYDIVNENVEFELESIKLFLSSIYNLSKRFKVILSTNASSYISILKKLYTGLSVIASDGLFYGGALNAIVGEVKTPYVFVAKNVQFLTNDSRLERLVRELESLDIKVAGGSFRNPDGQWRIGCFQSVYRNFTLKYLEGYDESIHECLFCDFIQGPFVASKDLLATTKFIDLPVHEGLFEDWFLYLRKQGVESIVCPDSMFHTFDRLYEQRSQLTTFMKKWDLFKVVSANGNTVSRECPRTKVPAERSRMSSPCSLQYNADAVKIIMNICESSDIYCELQEGTALGAIKFSKTLPWDLDADLTFLMSNYSSLQKLKNEFEKRQFSFTTWGSMRFKLHFKGWKIELYENDILESANMVTEGLKPTKILLDGQWVNVPRNPGLFIRNRYGVGVYQHAQHWMTMGKANGWKKYSTNRFTPCYIKDSHDCLDRYNADGNLAFNEMLP